MKKILILTAVGVFMTVPAMAVQKCIAKPEYDGEGTSFGDSYNEMDWGYQYSNGVKIKGITTCSNKEGTFASTTESLTHSGGSEDRFCWGRVISPAITPWIYSESYQTGEECAYWCNSDYKYYPGYDSEFINVIFNSLSN